MSVNSKIIVGVALACIGAGIGMAVLSSRGEPKASSNDLTAIIEAKSDDALVVEWREWSAKIELAEQQGAEARSLNAMRGNRDRIARILDDRQIDPTSHTVDEQVIAEERDD